MSWTATVASAETFLLGEGPLWDAPRERLLWVDVDAGTVHEGRLDGDRVVVTGSQHRDRTVGAVGCSAAGDLLVAGAQTLHTTREVRVVPAGARRRLNDGACDPAGAFLVGTLALGDAEGHLWIAVWGAGEVRRFTPDGRPAGIVTVPAPHTTSVAFAGPGLNRLLITTATAMLDAEQLAAYPMSGRLFLADVGVTGLPVTPWAGPIPGET